MPPNHALIGTSEACKMLGVSRSTFHRWVSSGKVRYYEVGPYRRKRFQREDILALVREPQDRAEPDRPEGG